MEALPATWAAQQVGAALERDGVAAYAHLDVDALAKVLKQLRTLHLALETGAVGFRIGRRRPKDPVEHSAPSATAKTPDAHRLATGLELPGWGRPPLRRSVPSSWRRPHAPLQYPWGPEPPVSPPRRNDPVTVPRYTGPWVDPYLARVRAEADGESEALRRNGVVQYHGPDEPPTYALRDTAQACTGRDACRTPPPRCRSVPLRAT